MKLTEIILDKFPPQNLRAVWLHPTDTGIEVFIYNNGKWQEISVLDKSGDSVTIGRKDSTFTIIAKDGIVHVQDQNDNTYQVITTATSVGQKTSEGGEIFNDYDGNSAGATYAHAEGQKTIATGNSAHAEGYNTQAIGDQSHTEGRDTTAMGNQAHAEGYNTKAIGHQSHTEGYNTKASGSGSHAEGIGTQATNRCEHAEGMYNVSNNGGTNDTRTVHSVGVGSSSAKRNAHEIMWNGDHYVYGLGGYDGTNYADAQTLQEVINGKEDTLDILWSGNDTENEESLYQFLSEVESRSIGFRLINDPHGSAIITNGQFGVGIEPIEQGRNKFIHFHYWNFNYADNTANHYGTVGINLSDKSEWLTDGSYTLIPTVPQIDTHLKENYQPIITPGTGLAFDGDTLNVTLDTTVFKVVSALPAAPAAGDENKIFLIPAESTGTNNSYTEYLYVNNTWEEFGKYISDVDLTPYLKIIDAQSTYATKTELATHTGNTSNPHNVTKSQVGLGNVDNTSDANKPVSTAQQAAINAVDNKTAVYTTVPTLSADYTIPANATTREYIYEISIGATKYNVTAAEGIKWIDNNLPLVEANSKLIVSVVNNIAVWGTVYE